MKKIMTGLVCGLILLGSTSGVIAHASESQVDKSIEGNSTILDNLDNSYIDLEYYENSPYFNVEYNGEDFEIFLKEDALIQYALDNDLPLPQKNSIMSRAAGRTGVSGKISSGNFSVFIKKSDLNWLANNGNSFVGALIGGLPGWAGGAILDRIFPGNYKHGRVFVFQGYAYSYWYYQ